VENGTSGAARARSALGVEGLEVLGIREVPASLEDVFVAMVSDSPKPQAPVSPAPEGVF
jgi:hypothetical protein